MGWLDGRIMRVRKDFEPAEPPGNEVFGRPEIFGRPVVDAVIGFGQKREQFLSEQTSHWLSYQFKRNIGNGRAMQLLWDMGIAKLTEDRIGQGSESDPLVNLWCMLARRRKDPGELWIARDGWTEDEVQEVIDGLQGEQ